MSLRLAAPSDAPAIAAIYAPYVRETTISFELEAPTADEMARRIAAVAETYPYLVLELDGRVVAYAYATRLRARPAYDWIGESSVYVAIDQCGRGHGRRVYRALFELLALQGLWWVYAAITLPNPGSQRFHAQLGFEAVGRFPAVGFKHGSWCDIDWWRLRLAAAHAEGPPAPIRPIGEPSLATAIAAVLERHQL